MLRVEQIILTVALELTVGESELQAQEIECILRLQVGSNAGLNYAVALAVGREKNKRMQTRIWCSEFWKVILVFHSGTVLGLKSH